MLEKSKLKKKSKYLKKPLLLKNTISETLAHNSRIDSVFKKQESKQIAIKAKCTPQQKNNKLEDLYQEVKLQHKNDSDSDNSEQLLLADLERREEDEENMLQKKDKKNMLFSHLVKDTGRLTRKSGVLEQRINQRIKKYSVQSKIKEMSSERASLHRQNPYNFIPKTLQRQLQRLNEEGVTEVRLSSMQLTHLSLLRIKDQVYKAERLKILDLSHNVFTNKSMPILAQMINHNPIEQLSLKWNQITYQGVMVLLQTVINNINLTSLDLSHNRLTNTNPLFQNYCLRLLTENRYLVHLNLQMCHLSEIHCAAIANTYNLTNESILCLHFKGNSNYYVNKLGYIAHNRKHKEVTDATLPGQFGRRSRVQQMPNIGRNYLLADDCCWLCQQWVGEIFKFPQEILPAGLSYKEEQYFIHLSCYDYQPIKLSNEQCVNTFLPKNGCKRLQWTNFQIHLAQIPIPANKDVKYFITNNAKALLNQDDPIIETNQLVSFEVFDVYSQLYANTKTIEKYSVFVRRMNIRKKEQFAYNIIKQQKQQSCQSHFKEMHRKENQKALKTILSKSRKMGMHTPTFEPLPRISKTKPNSPTHSRTHTVQIAKDNMNVILKIRKSKQKWPSAGQSQQYLSLGITPRNRHLLFNYKHFHGKDFHLQSIQTLQEGFSKVETEYFGNFKQNSMTKFLRQMELNRKKEPFIDNFKILTRRFFNSHQLFFSDIFNFIYSSFVSKGSSALEQNQTKQNSKNKTVKFEANVRKEKKLSILVNSQKHLQGKIGTQIISLGSQHQKAIQRRALSMNCISDKYQLTKIKAMNVGSIHTIQANVVSTDKTIKSFKKLPADPSSLVQLELDHLPLPIDLTDEAYAIYSTLVKLYARQKRILLELLSTFQKNTQKERMKDLNEIILTYNYYRLSLYYEDYIQNGLQTLFIKYPSFSALSSLIATSQGPLAIFTGLFQKRKSSMLSGSVQLGIDTVQDLQILQKQINSQNSEQSLLFLAEYLNNQNHPIKVLMRNQGTVLKSSKKRKGKYGRSLKNIKEELLGEQKKVVLPLNSDEFLHDIEQQELNQHYNSLVRHLNTLSDAILDVLTQLINTFTNTHNFGEERGIVEQWLKAHLTARIADFISDILAQYRMPGIMSRIKEKSGEIQSHFVLNSVFELTRACVMFGSSILQQNLKEYQFVSNFHSYEFIMGLQLTKLTHILRAFQDNTDLLQQHLTEVLRLFAESWKKLQFNIIAKQKKKKQAQMNRKKKRVRTINQSLDRSLTTENVSQQI